MVNHSLFLQPRRMDFHSCVYADDQFYSWQSYQDMFNSCLLRIPHDAGDKMQLERVEQLEEVQGELVGMAMQVMGVVPIAAAMSWPANQHHRMIVVTWQCYQHSTQQPDSTPTLLLRKPEDRRLHVLMPTRECLDLYRTAPSDHVVYLLSLDDYHSLLAMDHKLQREYELWGEYMPSLKYARQFTEAEQELYNEVDEPSTWVAYALTFISEAVVAVRQEAEPEKLSLQLLMEERAGEYEEYDWEGN